jgi:hypothetical protein
MAKMLENVFEAKWAQKPVRSSVSESSGHHGGVHFDGDDSDSERILEINRQILTLQHELNEILMRKSRQRHSMSTGTGASSVAKPPAPKKAQQHQQQQHQKAEDELNRPMTFEEKRQLSMDVNNLAPEKLGRVVEIIHDSMPNLKDNADSEVIELDIEALDVRTLRKLQQYVRECNKKRKAKPAGQPSKKMSSATAAPSVASAAPATPGEGAVFPNESSDDSSDESGDE